MNDPLTIMPAKFESTRLPNKNIRSLGGQPMINYTIEAAQNSGVCGEIMVSTENEEISAIARSAGAKVPFMRPRHLAKDPYGVVDVCTHVLDEYEKRGKTFSKLIILLPTSPFRSSHDIQASNRIFDEKGAEFLMSVSEFEHNPFGALKFDIQGNEMMVPCFPQHIGKKRHDLPTIYRVNGAICIVNVTAFRDAGTYYGNPLYTYRMPWYRGIDIDTESDLKFAEFLLSSGKINEK